MTAKRFTSQRTDDYNFSDVLDKGKWVDICHVDCEDDFVNKFNELAEENEQLKQLIKETLEVTPMEHSLAIKLKNSIREMYE